MQGKQSTGAPHDASRFLVEVSDMYVHLQDFRVMALEHLQQADCYHCFIATGHCDLTCLYVG